MAREGKLRAARRLGVDDDGVAVGDDVFGVVDVAKLGGASAEFAVLQLWDHKPAGMSWSQAGAAGSSVETATRALDPNPQFMAVARGVLEPTTSIVVGCRTGPRAEAAARLLEEAGYRDVAWGWGGYVGITDPAGRPVARGWLELQYPTSNDTGEGVGYASLRRKAGV